MTSIEEIQQPRIPQGSTEATAVEQARAVAEVAAAVRVAREFPRSEDQARTRMQRACATRALADRAFYSLPRAGGRVEGSTVHLAREIASCWGNVDYGIREMRRDDDAGVSEMQAWAWDQETNVRSSRSFVVPHARMVGSEKKGNKRRERLTDLGDVANNNNSVAARAVRETIFTVLPIWFVTEAEEIASAVLRGEHPSHQQQPVDATQQLVDGFAGFGVTVPQLEAYVAIPRDEWTPQTVGSLRVLGGEIKRGEKRVRDEFPDPQLEPAKVTAADVSDAEGQETGQ